MPDVFLYSGEASPNNVMLSDPTVQRGGGGSFSAAIVEALNATELVVALLLAFGSVTETANATEQSDATISYAVSITESGSASEAIDATITEAVAITESANATETQDRTLTVQSAITESASATESEDRLLTVAVTISEAASATETEVGLVTAVGATTEAASATETEAGLVTAIGSVSENADAIDSQSELLTAQGTVTEAATATDSQSATLTVQSAITESASATETETGLVTAIGSITEATTATETEDGLITAVGSVTEAASASDTENGLVTRSAAIMEAASATESEDRLLIVASSIAESTNATTAQDGAVVSIFNKSVVESATAIDNVSAITTAPIQSIPKITAALRVRQVSKISSRITNRLPKTFIHSPITNELQQWIDHISDEISIAWNNWQMGVKFGGVTVSGVGIGAWTGTGTGGKFDSKLSLNISPLYGTDGEKLVFDSLSHRFAAAFNEWVSSYEFSGVAYSGTSTATPTAPGTFSAISAPTSLNSGLRDKFSTLSDDICIDIGFDLSKSKIKEFLDTVQDGLSTEFNQWRSESVVGGDSVSGTAIIATGAGSGTSSDDGVIS